MAGDARLAVADDPAADLRPHAVAADQRAAAHLVAAFEPQRDLVALVDEVLHLAVGLQRDQIVALAGLEIDAVDVGAMGHRIGLPEALDERLAERDVGDQLAGERVAHLDSAGTQASASIEP